MTRHPRSLLHMAFSVMADRGLDDTRNGLQPTSGFPR